MDENGELEFRRLLQTAHLQRGFLWDVVGGFEWEANANLGFPLFWQGGLDQKFPQEGLGKEGQEWFSYTLYSLMQ